MQYLLLFGLYSWLALGLTIGLLAPPVLQRRRRRAALLGVIGAALGGLLATALGFGGLSSFDGRSLITAGLAAVLALLLGR